MLRLSGVLHRTSRRGPGGWTNPTLATMGRGALETRGAQQQGPVDHRTNTGPSASASRLAQQRAAQSASSGTSSAPYSFLSSASFYDAGDNAQQQAMTQEGAAHNNWRTDRRFSTTPSFYRNVGLRGQPFSAASGDAGATDPSDSQSARRVARDPKANADRVNARLRGEGDASGSGTSGGAEPGEGAASWLGGKGRGSSSADPAMSRHRGVNNFSMIDREEVTLTSFMKMMMDATFQPRDADSKVFGGDNQSKMAEQKEELKNMDPRLVPFAHENLMNDYLKNIQQLHSPSGQLTSRDMLKGRLVGLLFFTESERCFRFMRLLKTFHKRHSPDFVVVAVSMGGKEMLDVTRGFGFFQVTHRDGATWVKRDAGIMMRPFMPMPRLVVVDGTSGQEVCRSGLTAVLVNPDTAFAAWKRGESGVGSFDWARSLYF